MVNNVGLEAIPLGQNSISCAFNLGHFYALFAVQGFLIVGRYKYLPKAEKAEKIDKKPSSLATNRF